MKYFFGIIIFLFISLFILYIYKRFKKEANREILRKVKKEGFDNYKQYAKIEQKKEYKKIKKARMRKKLERYQKKYVK